MQKWIVYFDPQDKKIQLNQYHIEANDNTSALEKFRNKCNYKTLGIRQYHERFSKHFINDKFY